MRQILTREQTGGRTVCLSGKQFLIEDGDGFRPFDIAALDVPGFNPGRDLHTQISFIIMAICAGVL